MDKASQENMSAGLIIYGVREDNRKFRPSDWAERISATLAVFGRDHKLRYSEYAQPCIIEGQKCLVVTRGLREMDHAAYEFILDFAHANQLRIQEDRRVAQQDVGQDRRQQDWDYAVGAEQRLASS